MGDEPSTLIEPTDGPGLGSPPPPNGIVLVIACCSGEPDRVGQLLVPSGAWSVFGRGVGAPTDPHPRLDLLQVRPGRVDGAPPLMNPHLSRVQARECAFGAYQESASRLC
jgi:hypothetical protein